MDWEVAERILRGFALALEYEHCALRTVVVATIRAAAQAGVHQSTAQPENKWPNRLTSRLNRCFWFDDSYYGAKITAGISFQELR